MIGAYLGLNRDLKVSENKELSFSDSVSHASIGILFRKRPLSD